MKLPGDVLRYIEPHTKEDCDCGQPSTLVVQGETDSFGYETHTMCESCHDKLRANKEIGDCDWCKATEVELRPIRDWEEGTHGPVYYVCQCCKRKQDVAIEEEYNRGY